MILRKVLGKPRMVKLIIVGLLSVLIPNFSPTAAQANSCSPAATSTVDIYTVLTFTSTTTCNWTVPTGVTSIDLFMVGGGGGGGSDGGGGGGGGAAISRTAFAVTAGNSLALTVGTGGAPSTWAGYPGDNGTASTLVRTSPSVTLTANGGTKGTNAPAGVAGAGGTAVNGGFAGGIGGTASGTLNRKGGDGATGISNYFSGSRIEYGGGGGGGSYYGASSFTETLGKSGGGNGGASASGNNRPGNPGRANSGGGGGGGSANVPQQDGGRGADGVILIRYATSSSNAFPSSLISSLTGRFTPNDLQILDNGRKGWIDSSGTQATATNITTTSATSMSITTRGTTDGANSTGSSKELLIAKGGTGDLATLVDLSTNYTVFHLARYVTGGSLGRIMAASSSGSNWLSGHHVGTYKCAHHNSWLTSSGCSSTGIYRWLLSTDQLRYYRADGQDVTLNPDDSTYLANQSISAGFGINNHVGGQRSDWEFADLLVFNKRLSPTEIFLMESYLANIYGLTISTPPANSETDTAVNLNSQYFYGYYRNDFTFNDTFTMETWVKPASSCATGTCSLFSAEATLVTKIQDGIFQYALYGTASNWEWIGTGVRVPSNEWTHITFSKVLPGNQTNAIQLYINGQLAYTRSGSPYRLLSASNSTTDVVNPLSTWYYIGARTDGTKFYGAIDEFKYWDVPRSQTEIASDMHSNAVNHANLEIYYDFNFDSLSNSLDVQNLALNGGGRTNLKPSTTMTYERIGAQTTSGPYTIVTFTKSHITQFSGWRVPAGVSVLSALVVAGGGGGGAESDDTGWFAGGGGAGGYQFSLQSGLNRNLVEVVVGAGGRGGAQVTRDASGSTLPTNGQDSRFQSLTSVGGGSGGVSYTAGRLNGSAGGSGGGGATYSGLGGAGTAGQGNSGGNAASTCCAGGGGGGFGSAGGNGSAPSAGASVGGSAGNGVLNPIFVSGVSPQYVAAGGAGGSFTTAGSAGSLGGTPAWTDAIANSGSGGGGGGSSPTVPDKPGGKGGSGIVIVRWITASVPSYTKPVNTTINLGMTETFTVNVATDSATAQLTRTFRWESSTAGAGGPWTLLKQGTGASNAFFSWVPPDTSTSGSNFLYRLTVTDSDTAGLFITDSSTAFAIINGALLMSGSQTISKTINTSKIETFTVTSGTPTYRYSLSPPISGISLDTSTVGMPRVVLAETLTVGTYLETLTVTDSISATFSIPLRITVSAPPSLSNGSEIVTTGQVFHIDSGNSASVTPGSSASGSSGVRDISGARHTVTVNGTALAYSDDSGGLLTLSASNSNFLQFTKRSTLTSWTIEGYVRITAAPSNVTCLVTNQYTSVQINYSLCIDQGLTWFSGFHNRDWTYKRAAAALNTNTWYHLVGTYDLTSQTVELYLNGQRVTSLANSSANAGGTTPPAGDTQEVYIGRLWDSNIFLPMNLGVVRIYDRALTGTQVLQNFSATRARFTTDNLSAIKPVQKHNTTTVETFTVTAGGDTKTVTFAVGNRTGLEWNTSDSTTVRLTVKPELTVGTYFDTVTVTDNLGSSSFLPLRITINKGDQAKLSFGQYNAFPGVSSYPINVYGGSGSGTVTRSLVDSGTAGCVLTSSMFLTAARVGACTVRAVKATDTNWLAETATATIYWIQWSDAYATRAPSTPNEIVLNHQTAITKYNYDTLTVTSYQNSSGVTITSISTGATLRIIGDGFSPTAAYTEVVFASMDAVDLSSGLQVISSGGSNYLQLTVPSGATTGAITVNSPKGTAVGPSLTILSP